MPEAKIIQDNPPLGVDHAELYFPDDSDITTGVYTFAFEPNTLSRAGVATVSLSNVPAFAIRADICSATREVLIQVGRADNTPPSWGIFSLPKEFDPSETHEFEVHFTEWEVVQVKMDCLDLNVTQKMNWQDMPIGPIVGISPALKGHVAPRDLIQAIGSFMVKIVPQGRGLLFRVTSESYLLEVGFTEQSFYILRNSDRLETPIKPGTIICFAEWHPAHLKVLLLANSEVKLSDPELVARETKTLQTSTTIPSYSLLDWARRQSIVPMATYASQADFNQTVTDSLLSVPDKVAALGIQNAFWDKTYEGKRIVSQHPKSEPDIQPTIHGLLHDICLAKNIQVSREYIAAGGRLDFLFSGHLNTGSTVEVCAELKHAHSQDISHGLLKQLPAYMRAKGCDFGLYCVMYFRDAEFSEPQKYADANDLLLTLDQERLSAGLTNIRILIMDFSHQKSPSRL
jgi:hypothetical protein